MVEAKEEKKSEVSYEGDNCPQGAQLLGLGIIS